MYDTKQTTKPADRVPRIALVVLGILFVTGIFVVGFEQGQIVNAVLAGAGVDPMIIHEFSHDFRHAAGFPCH